MNVQARPYRVGDTIKFVANNTLMQGVILKRLGDAVHVKSGVDKYDIDVKDIRQLVLAKPTT